MAKVTLTRDFARKRAGGYVVTEKIWHRGLRRLFAGLPQGSALRHLPLLRRLRSGPSQRLQLKIAETREELEACFSLLHDAYVDAGFMRPDPSGMRVTIYHALPTTTTLCAKWDGVVEPSRSSARVPWVSPAGHFDLSDLRAREADRRSLGLAVHPKFRKTGGAILFPLMKFMYEYSTTFFDTRHLVIAVNQNRIEMYESLLFFQRLTANVVEEYDFANGAPAVGASLDLLFAPAVFKNVYGKAGAAQPGGLLPRRRTAQHQPAQAALLHHQRSGDDPELLDYFFNVRTQGFANLDDRKESAPPLDLRPRRLPRRPAAAAGSPGRASSCANTSAIR